jgi:hypothetical protein
VKGGADATFNTHTLFGTALAVLIAVVIVVAVYSGGGSGGGY